MELWHQIRNLIGSWARGDQIRVSPTTGRLLGLRPGDRFVLRGESYTVESRTLVQEASTPRMEYQLYSSSGHCRLVVDVKQIHEIASGELEHDDDCVVVFDDDIAFLA